jgi:hypothetical protein
MARKKSDRPTPKRGAYPTPRNVLAESTPYKPSSSDQDNKPNSSNKPDPASEHPAAESDSAAEVPEAECESGNEEKGS